jgi:polysaccharide export outer membrane protein
VGKDGTILLPVIGQVYVSGKTLEEIKNDLQVRVDVYYKDAIIDVKTAGIKINVLGEVNSPGTYTFYQNEVSIFDVLSTSGDLTELANREQIKILRHNNNIVSVHKLDLTSDALLSSEFYMLQPNDVLYVEPLRVKTWGVGQTGWQTFQTLLTTISSTFLIINYFNQ